MMILDSHEKDFLAEDPSNVLYKVDKGVDMLNQIFGTKKRLDFLLSYIKKGVSQFFTIRGNIVYLIRKFNPDAEKQALKSSSSSISQTLFKLILLLFALY